MCNSTHYVSKLRTLRWKCAGLSRDVAGVHKTKREHVGHFLYSLLRYTVIEVHWKWKNRRKHRSKLHYSEEYVQTQYLSYDFTHQTGRAGLTTVETKVTKHLKG